MSNSYSENGCSPPVPLQNFYESSAGGYCDLKFIYSKAFSLQENAVQNEV